MLTGPWERWRATGKERRVGLGGRGGWLSDIAFSTMLPTRLAGVSKNLGCFCFGLTWTLSLLCSSSISNLAKSFSNFFFYEPKHRDKLKLAVYNTRRKIKMKPFFIITLKTFNNWKLQNKPCSFTEYKNGLVSFGISGVDCVASLSNFC